MSWATFWAVTKSTGYPDCFQHPRLLFIFFRSRQGEEIGRIFASWVIVYSGQFIEKLQK
jgi:hypothetical protein